MIRLLNGRRSLVCLILLGGAVLIRLLGEQGARLGPLQIAPVDFRWIAGLGVIGFFLVSRSRRKPSPRSLALAVIVLLGAAWPLSRWRDTSIRRTSALVATVARSSDRERTVERTVVLDSLNLDARREIHRVVGRRRDITLVVAGFIFAPQSGIYRFATDCDDACQIVIDEVAICGMEPSAVAEVTLEKGLHRLTLEYQQAGGPAHLRVEWDRPGWVELLPLEHYVSGGADALAGNRLMAKEIEAGLSLLALWIWWLLVLLLWLRAGETRSNWKEILTSGRTARWAPTIGATLLVLYGALLRFDALLVRSGLAVDNAVAASVHQRILPILPSYGLFHPESTTDSPYRADVRSYLDRAQSLSFSTFYQASFREPFYVALVKLFVAACGGREIGILVQSFFFSVAALPLAFAVAGRLTGRWWALGLLLPLVIHEWLILEAPSGYRMSAYAFLLLAFAGWVFLARTRRIGLGALVAGLLGGILCLVRLSALSFVVPLLLLKGWETRKERGWHVLGISLLVVAVVVGPFLLSCYLATGDPFYSVSFHTRFWLEAEGGPIRTEGPLSLYRYFVEHHRAAGLALGTFRGLTLLPIRTFWNGLAQFPLLDAVVLVAGIAGLLLGLWSHRPFLFLAYIGHLIPFAYIQNFPSGEMPRFVMPAYYFLVLAAGVAGSWLQHKPWSFRRRPRPTTPG